MAGVSEQRLRNPFRSETDAFRLLGLIGAGIAAIVIAAAVGGAAVGVPVAVILGAFATRASYRWISQQIEAPDEEPGEGSAP